MVHTRWLTIFILGLLMIGSSAAQDASQPLIVLEGKYAFNWELDDIQDWLPRFERRQTHLWEYFRATTLSPLNDELAYYSGRYIVIEKNINSGLYSGKFPGDLEIINPVPSESEAASPIEIAPLAYFNLSSIMWSPDGTQIAWTQGLTTGDTTDYALLMHDRTSGITRFLSVLPPEHSPYGAVEGVWTEEGIVVFSDTHDQENYARQNNALVFDPVTGQQRLAIPVLLPVPDEPLFPRRQIAAQYQGKTWLAALYVGDKDTLLCQLFDLKTGDAHECPALPTALIASHAETSLRVTPIAYPTERVFYRITRADGTPLPLSEGDHLLAASFALSPDGSVVAFLGYDTLEKDYLSDQNILVWQDERVTPMPKGHPSWHIMGVMWATPTWVIPEGATEQPQ